MVFKQEKSPVQIAFTQLEQVFSTYKNTLSHQSNKHPLGDPNRVEHDISDINKAHLDLLRAKIDVEIAQNNARLTDTMNSLTRWVVFLTFVSSMATLIQAWPIIKKFF